MSASASASASKSWLEGVLDSMSGKSTNADNYKPKQQHSRLSEVRSYESNRTFSSIHSKLSYIESLKKQHQHNQSQTQPTKNQTPHSHLQRDQTAARSFSKQYHESPAMSQETDDDWNDSYNGNTTTGGAIDSAMDSVCVADHFCGAPCTMGKSNNSSKAITMRDLQEENKSLLSRTETLLHEKEQALLKANRFNERLASTNDVTVQTLQQRCHEADTQNQQLQDLVDQLKDTVQKLENGGNGVEETKSHLLDTENVVAMQQIQKQQSHRIDELEHTLSTMELERANLENEHAGVIENLRLDLIQVKEMALRKESDLQFELEQLQCQQQIDNSHEGLEITDLEILTQRDDTITELRSQCLDYSRQLTVLTQAKLCATEELQDKLDQKKQELTELHQKQQEQMDAQTSSNKAIQDGLNDVIERLHIDKKAILDESAQLKSTCEDLEAKLASIGESNEHLTMQLEEATLNHQEVVQDWQMTVEKIKAEVELLNSKDRREEELHSTIQELDSRHTSLECTLLETKLTLAAVQEEKDALAESHTTTLVALDEEKELKLQEGEMYRATLRQYENDMASLRANATIWEELNAIHLDAVRKLTIDLEAGDVADDCGEKKADDSFTSEDKRHNLTTEIERLAQLLQRYCFKNINSDRLIETLDHNNAAINYEAQIQELQHQLDDRDQTIAKLIQSSTSLEQDLRDRLQKSETEETADQPQTRGLLSTAENSSFRINDIEQLTAELSQVRDNLKSVEIENSRLRVKLEATSSSDRSLLDFANPSTLLVDDIEDSNPATDQLLERDEAIAALVKQSMAQDKVISELRQELKLLQSTLQENEIKSKNVLVEWRQEIESLQSEAAHQVIKTDEAVEESKRLKEEAHVFASQVVELDDEIEHLKSQIIEKEAHIKAVQKEFDTIKTLSLPIDSERDIKVKNLEAEVDELMEANKTQLEEIRELRRINRIAEEAPDQIASARNDALAARLEANEYKLVANELREEIAVIQAQLVNAQTSLEQKENEYNENRVQWRLSNERLESTILEKQKEFDELLASPSRLTEEEIVALQNENKDLKRNNSAQGADVDSARATIRELEQELAEKSAEAAVVHEEEKEELMHEIESLTAQLESARDKIKSFEADEAVMNEFKDKLERADEAREQSEKNIVDNYERRISLLVLDRDVVIDKLRKELFSEKENNEEELQMMSEQVKQYQVEISDLQEEMKEEIEKRELRIMALEHTLSAQEQLVGNMKAEMDHLQNSMESAAARRHEEIDEMQQELLQVMSLNAKHEREMQTLKLEIESKDIQHKTEVDKLQDTIVSLDKGTSDRRTAADLQMELRVKEVKDRLEKLKWRNTSLREENENLRERLELAESMAKDSVDHERLREIESELSKQLKKVKSLENELKGLRDPSGGDGSPSSVVPTNLAPISESSNIITSPRKIRLFGRKSKSDSTGDERANR